MMIVSYASAIADDLPPIDGTVPIAYSHTPVTWLHTHQGPHPYHIQQEVHPCHTHLARLHHMQREGHNHRAQVVEGHIHLEQVEQCILLWAEGVYRLERYYRMI